jgi:hypothetical protein
MRSEVLRYWRDVAVAEIRTVPHVWFTLALNLALAVGWLLVDPLQYHQHGKTATLMTYLATFALADVVTTNMFADHATRAGGPRHERFGGLLHLVVMRNLSRLLLLGGPLLLITVVLAAFTETRSPLFPTVTVSIQVLVWLSLGAVVSALLPVAKVPLRQWWADRRHPVVTLWRLLSIAVPYLMAWVLVPSDGRRMRLPGLGAVHRRTPGAGGVTGSHHAFAVLLAGLLLWVASMVIATLLLRRARTFPNA